MTEFQINQMKTEWERRNFRIPVEMDSFLYPTDHSWQGRRRLKTVDLSCGGLAFYADSGLEIGDVAQVVLPMTVDPLIVRIKLLRKENAAEKKTFYAAKFIDLSTEEDQMICEAVFNIETKNRPRIQGAEAMEV